MRYLKALLAAAVICLLVLGVPIALTAMLGNPLDELHWSGPIGDDMILAVLGIVAWVFWVQMLLAFTLETVNQVRQLTGRRPTATTMLALPGQQQLIRLLVSTVLAAGVASTATAPATAAASDATPDATPTLSALTTLTATPAAPAVPAPSSTSSATPHTDIATKSVTVNRGDTLWGLASQHLGSGEQWHQIAELNRGRDMGEGIIATDAVLRDQLRPGWTLLLPDSSSTPVTPSGSYEVQPGDTLSQIAQDHTGSAAAYLQLFEASKDTIQPGGSRLSDPDHIEPGWMITLPEQATADETAATTPEPAAADTPETPAEPAPAGPPPAAAPPAAAPPAHPPVVEEHENPAAAADELSADDVDDTASAPWLIPGLATGGGVLLAGALLVCLRTRRRAQFRARRPGRMIATPDPSLASVEKTLTVAGSRTAATVEFMDAALLRLAAAAGAAGETMPAVAAVELGAATVTLHLSAPSRLPSPWQGTPDDLHWQLDTDTALDELGPEPAQAEPPYPLLVTVGAADTGETWLLNCEELSTLVIGGDQARGRSLARHLVAQLAVNPWSRGVQVDCVGVGAEGTPLTGRVRYHEPTAGAGVTAQILADALATVERAEAAGVDVSTGRTGRVDDDVWASRMLLLDAAAQEPAQLQDLLNLITDKVGRTGTSVVVAGDRAGSEPTLEVTAEGRVRLPHAGLDLVAVSLEADDLAGCALLLAQSEQLEDVEIPVDETAVDGWEAYADVTGGLRREHTLPRDTVPDDVDEPVSCLLPEPDEHYIATAGVVAEDLATLARKVPERVRREVEAANATLDDDVADWFNPSSDRPKLTLLGDIGARTHGEALSGRKPYFTEMLAFLALHRKNGVTLDELQTAMCISTPAKTRVYVNTLRKWLGTNPRTGELYLPHADKSPAALNLGRNVYQLDEDLLIDTELFKRLRERADARGEDGLEDLFVALELVSGRPFSKRREAGWSWLDEGDRLDQHMAVAIADAAFLATVACLGKGDLTRAREAAKVAAIAVPDEEATRLCLIMINDAEGDRREARRILVDEVCNRSDDGEPPTELSDRTKAIIAANPHLLATG